MSDDFLDRRDQYEWAEKFWKILEKKYGSDGNVLILADDAEDFREWISVWFASAFMRGFDDGRKNNGR